MNVKNKKFSSDEIDVVEITLTLWKEKFLIFTITLSFVFLGYIYAIFQPKVYQSTIVLRDAPTVEFIKYSYFLPLGRDTKILYLKQNQYDQSLINSAFNDNFKMNLTSITLLKDFVDQYVKSDKFKSFLKTNNINNKDYFKEFQNDFIIKKKKGSKNQYSLNFVKPFIATEFLNDFVIHVKQITENIFKKQLIRSINNEIEIYNRNLDIAKTINLENPVMKSGNMIGESFDKSNELFLRGSKVLTKQKLYLEKLLNETKNFTVNYNPIIDNPLDTIQISKSISFYLFIAFLIGFSFSLFAIFIKGIIKTKN